MNHSKIVFLTFMFFSSMAYAALTDLQKSTITRMLKTKIPDWSEEKTNDMLNQAKNAGDFTAVYGGGTKIKIMGDTVFIDGKDVTGTLGSKNTYGDNSPIVENNTDSHIATGPNAKIENSVNLKIVFPLSLSLVGSIGLNFYQWKKRRKKKV